MRRFANKRQKRFVDFRRGVDRPSSFTYITAISFLQQQQENYERQQESADHRRIDLCSRYHLLHAEKDEQGRSYACAERGEGSSPSSKREVRQVRGRVGS